MRSFDTWRKEVIPENEWVNTDAMRKGWVGRSGEFDRREALELISWIDSAACDNECGAYWRSQLRRVRRLLLETIGESI